MAFRRTMEMIVKARDSDELVDYAFICEGRQINVHKLIVGVQSPVFKAACSGKFEKTSKEYDLADFPLSVVNQMVEYMYKGTYEEDLSGGHSSLSFHAAMYAMAEKYMIQGLKAQTIRHYDNTLRHETDIVTILESVSYVYSSTPGDARGLRDLVISFVRSRLLQSYSSSRVYGAFQRALDNEPSFMRDLLDSFMRSPSIGSCSSCKQGWFVNTEILQSRCKSCGRGGARSWPVGAGHKETVHLI
ncbi:uncharacterized protein F5Z01DRAFT_495970 [Emericellopsis atlantica]|uniref:BTB domain-containing protein n=1 Tax=Emericellopsis atlantica TaxID=2614577 RepID=A0A9P7ZCB3_9HYPO|nr:uncharacterized protein F5Z01DRAFT_495970 [Emericellopsis atlantica]KAG9249474.1 hypothetical protein F5Z01DRAFT_495970 [Emericellopsis atlantica]